MMILGLFLLLTFALPQYILDEVLREGTGYSNGAIDSDSPVRWLFWPLFAFEKASYIGGVTMWLGVLVIALALADRRINRQAAAGEKNDAAFKKLGLALFAIGTLGGTFNYYVLEDFLIPTATTIGIAATGDFMFLSDWSAYPGWLRTSINILGYTWWIPTLLGMILFIGGRRAALMIVSIVVAPIALVIAAAGGILGSIFSSSSTPSSGGGSGSSSSSSAPPSPPPDQRPPGQPRP